MSNMKSSDQAKRTLYLFAPGGKITVVTKTDREADSMHKRLALTPPMGWNSWDCYGAAVNEEQLLANADYMAKHLKDYG